MRRLVFPAGIHYPRAFSIGTDMSDEPVEGILFSRFSQAFEIEGVGGIERIATGPYLVEILTQHPTGLPPSARVTPETNQDTVCFGAEVLLELKRVRGVRETKLYPIPPGATIGRGRSCALRFPKSESLTKRHARFVEGFDGWRCEDLGSTNGTYVESRPVGDMRSAALSSFSLLQFGDCRFVFLEQADLLALLSPLETRGKIPIPNLIAELQGLGSRRFLMRHTHPYLLVVLSEEGKDLDAETQQRRPNVAFPLIGDDPLDIGRSRLADITLTAPSVSKKHARLSKERRHWRIEDTGSSYGTVLNAQQLPIGEPKRLTDWDALLFGGAVHGIYLESRSLLQYLTER